MSTLVRLHPRVLLARLLAGVLLLVPLALLLEGLQLAVPGRTVSWADAAANLAGLTTALLAPTLARRWRASPPASSAP